MGSSGRFTHVGIILDCSGQVYAGTGYYFTGTRSVRGDGSS